ncbi:MAG: hypothetical protein ACRENP_24360 [Longimicrobiales bacterium]
MIVRTRPAIQPMFLTDLQHRMRTGIGRFVSRADLEAKAGMDMYEVLAEVPGLHLTRSASGDPAVATRRSTLMSRGARGTAETDGSRAQNYLVVMGCTPLVFVDGVTWKFALETLRARR